ncbi:MAG TPA: hypothetical protein PLJ00_16445 [Chitinophagales bacterium]|nr:hypothetical protein [Chitinophagales bacterium]HRG29490.1 hypothetical protein [Chitinophagales bacterium]
MKKIFTVFVTTLGFLFSTDLVGQCRFEKNEIDDFNKTKTIQTEKERINSIGHMYMQLQFQYVGNKYFLMLKTNQEDIKFYVTNGQQLIFLFTDGTTLTLDCYSSDWDSETILGTYYEVYYMYYPLSATQMENFKSKEIEKYRLFTSEGTYDTPFNSKKDKDVKKLAECIIEEVGN